ncbi:MAG: aminotransferase class V-fold PLP-dependent enzyme [Gemmatimonadota bacterium]|nr:MAG: aminotransferase class V-fold PLP-dependent enzyme [Gemmatimonadota bacterium]
MDSAQSLDQQVVMQLRQSDFPWTAETVYMNNAATGPLPERSRRVLHEMTDKRVAPHLLDDLDMFALMKETRQTVARLINADAGEIGLTPNTGYGINIAAQALPLEPGDRVIISDGEFPANVYPWLHLKHRGVDVEVVPRTERGWPDEEALIQRLSRPSTRVLSISLVQFSTGYMADVERLAEACRAAGCYLVVDGIQGIGNTPFDVAATSVDIVACGGQKWLLSPWGSGFVYVRRELLENMLPPAVGWMAFEGTDDHTRLTDYSTTLHSDGRRLELVTLPYQDLLAMKESIDLLLRLGIDHIAEWLREVRRPIMDAALSGKIELTSPMGDGHESAIVCVVTADSLNSYRRLRQEGVICSFREGAIRLAPHCYNLPEEAEKAVQILTEQR